MEPETDPARAADRRLAHASGLRAPDFRLRRSVSSIRQFPRGDNGEWRFCLFFLRHE